MAYAKVYPLLRELQNKGFDEQQSTGFHKTGEKLSLHGEKWLSEFLNQGGTRATFQIAVLVAREMANFRGGDCCRDCCEETRVKDDDDYLGNLIHRCRCPCLSCKADPENRVDWSGVVVADSQVPESLNVALKGHIKTLEEKSKLDWHPGWEGVVRDIVHPSMYCSVSSFDPKDKFVWIPSNFQVIRKTKMKEATKRKAEVVEANRNNKVQKVAQESSNSSIAETETSFPAPDASVRSGLVFPVGKVHEGLCKSGVLGANCKVSVEASVNMTAVLEYFTAEILELSGNVARDNFLQTIAPKHVLKAIESDEELKQIQLVENLGSTEEEYFNDSIESKSEININIVSPINGLCRTKHAEIYDTIGSIFAHFVPLFENLLASPLPERCQVIVKLSNSYVNEESKVSACDIANECYGMTRNLRDNEAKGRVKPGDWHVEGTPEEAILATGIYYYDVENVDESYLEFKIPTYDIPHGNYEQDDPQAWIDFGMKAGGALQKYLGNVEVKNRRCIVFPNVLQHRPSGFRVTPPAKKGHRKMLVFFLVDPDCPTKSTEDGLPRQLDIAENELKAMLPLSVMQTNGIAKIIAEYAGTWTWEQACEARKKLMSARGNANLEAEKYFSEPCSLCEH